MPEGFATEEQAPVLGGHAEGHLHMIRYCRTQKFGFAYAEKEKSSF